MTQFMKDSSGRIVGYIDIHPNGDKVARNSSGQIVGYYYALANVTKDKRGSIVGYGDFLSAFLVK